MIIGYYDMEVFIIATNIKKVKKPDVESYTLHTNNKQTSNNIDSVVINGINNVNDIYNRTKATIAMGTIKAEAGLFNAIEFIGDGELWAVGKVFDGGTYALAQGIGMINPSAKSAIMDFRKNVDDWIVDDMAVDITGALQDELFNTDMGKNINDASFMKKDSVAAQRIEKVSKFGGEVALATAATVASGGAASPVLISTLGLGFAEGAGEQANNLYQQSTGTTTAKEASIFFSGLSEAATWYAYGRLGSGLIKLGGQVGGAITHGPYSSRFGAHNTLGGALRNIKDSMIKRDLKTYLKNSVKLAFTEKENIIDMFNGVTKEISDSLATGKSTGETIGRVAVDGLVQNILFNSIVGGVTMVGDNMKFKYPIETADVLDKRVISIIRTIIKTADAAEDSGAINVSLYDSLVNHN